LLGLGLHEYRSSNDPLSHWIFVILNIDRFVIT